jgi:hypothetical protein
MTPSAPAVKLTVMYLRGQHEGQNSINYAGQKFIAPSVVDGHGSVRVHEGKRVDGLS